MAMIQLPNLPNLGLLADLCSEAADAERVPPFTVEKDFYLTRLIWALAQAHGERLLLYGGTLLSKVDLGYRRMSEDVDLLIPKNATSYRSTNVAETNQIRETLRSVAPIVGVQLANHNGEVTNKGAHVIWILSYESTFGPQSINVEASMRQPLLPPRRARLSQLLRDPKIGSYNEAYCWALDADEARAEKVRAAFTREAIRDYYDLDQLLQAGNDFGTEAFKSLVDRKLAESKAPPLAEQAGLFGLTPGRRKALDLQLQRELRAVVRTDAPPFDLDAMLARFNEVGLFPGR